jgi:hypothetical protein
MTSRTNANLKAYYLYVYAMLCLKCYYSQSILFKGTNNFVSVLQNLFDLRIYKTNAPPISFLLFYFLYL